MTGGRASDPAAGLFEQEVFMSVLMALVDFIPVILFIISAVILQRGLYNRMSKGAFAVFSAGTIMVICAGIFKACWKLLYGAGICDFARLNQAFFPMQSIGFLLAGIAVIAMVFFKQGDGEKMYQIAAPAVFSGTIIFIAAILLGSLGLLRRPGNRKQTAGKDESGHLFHHILHLFADDGLSRHEGFQQGLPELDR